MLRIKAPYADEKTRFSGAPQLTWPQVCSCCGGPNNGLSYQLNHRARETSGGSIVAGGMIYETSAGGIDMSWPIPCCATCQAHSRKSRNPLRLKWTIVYGGIPTMFLGGFALWSMGVANSPNAGDDPAGAVIAVGFVCLNFLAWYGVWLGVGALMRMRGRGGTTTACADSVAPVSAGTDSRFVRFDFTNDAYAGAVAQANGLATEPARFAKVPVIVGDILARFV